MATDYTSGSAKSKSFSFGSGVDKITGSIDTYILKVLPQDLLTVLRGVAFDELDQQITGGNTPSQIIVDGRPVGRRGIIEAERSVSMRFADTRTLLSAIKDIYNALVRVTRIQAPPKNSIVARQNFFLYLNGSNLGQLPTALSKLTEGSLDSKSVLRVVGPLVNYGRKMYWNPIGRSNGAMEFRASTSVNGRETLHYDNAYSPRFKSLRVRTLKKLANSQGGNPAENLKRLLAQKAGTVEGMGQIVKRVMRRERRYAALYISDGWIKFPPAKTWGKHSRNDRVPSVSVQMAKRGAVSVVNLL